MYVLNLVWFNVCCVVMALGIIGCGGGDPGSTDVGDSGTMASDTRAVGDGPRAEYIADVRKSDFVTDDLGSDTPLDSGAPNKDGDEADHGQAADTMETIEQLDVVDMQDVFSPPDASDIFDLSSPSDASDAFDATYLADVSDADDSASPTDASDTFDSSLPLDTSETFDATEAPCQPTCDGKECGDDGCGGECGPCQGEQDACIENTCVCQPDCEGKGCGWDGCSALCIECTDGKMCMGATGTCECFFEPCGDTCCKNGQMFCHEGACVYYVEKPDVILTYENVSSTSAELWMENQVPVLGFQFLVSGLFLTSVTGGSTVDAGIGVSIGDANNFVLGFGLAQNTIPPGNEMLLKMEFVFKGLDSNFCLGNPLFLNAENEPADVLVAPLCYLYWDP